MKKNKIHEMKYNVLYDCKSALEAIVSNFSHSSMITHNTTFVIASNKFSISVIKRICIRSFTEGENPCLNISMSTLLTTVDSIDSKE